MMRTAFWLTSLTALWLATGCTGDDDYVPDDVPTSDGGTETPRDGGDDDGGGGDGGDDRCPLLELGDTALDFDSVARLGLQAPVSVSFPGIARTRLTLELYEDDGSGELPPLVPGTFSFSTPPDDNYGTCQHCVLLVASDRSGAPKRAFYAKSGTFTVTALDETNPSVVVGEVRDAVLQEVGQSEDFTWFDVPDGACFRVPTWSFDTRVVNGGPCESVEQCPNEAAQVCDPSSATCGDPQCSLTGDPPFCGDGEVCFSQLVGFDEAPRGPATGACYRTCDTADPGSCGEGSTCRVLGPTQTLGICQRVGNGAPGAACTPRDIATGCTSGYVCEGTPGACEKTCTFLTPTTGCGEARYCGLGNVCERAEAGDPAAIGATCDPTSPELLECGIEGDAFRGLCTRFYQGAPTTCQRLCRVADPVCPSGQECLGLFENPDVGICRAPAVCGDGTVDPIGGEICDDGNVVSGDGCAADCKSAELGALCSDAPALPLDVSVTGTTVGGDRGFPSQCDPYVAVPVSIYSFVPPSAGRLHVEVSSTAGLGISLYGPCGDDTTELRCRNVLDVDELNLDVGTDPVLVMVRGADPETAGAFVLRASFLPAVCGDGQVVGLEVCDDGNTVNGDGCSADCSTVDYAVVCAQLPPLVLGANAGSNVTGSEYFDTTGSCAYVNGGGRERSYRFVAPSDGTLALNLTQPVRDFIVAVYDGCGPATEETYLACSNFAVPGTNEETSLPLTSGQLVTVTVQGFTDTDAGDYVLNATFTP